MITQTRSDMVEQRVGLPKSSITYLYVHRGLVFVPRTASKFCVSAHCPFSQSVVLGLRENMRQKMLHLLTAAEGTLTLDESARSV